jgi:hypothetical protein
MPSASYAKVTQNDEEVGGVDNKHEHQQQQQYGGDIPLLMVPEPQAMMAAVATSTPTVQVTSPADLPEGYEFQATVGSGASGGQQQRMIKVTVPPGGVEKGQVFSVPLPNESFDAVMGYSISIPVGHWRSGLFEFYKYGICHPHCWTSCCCTTCKCFIFCLARLFVV